MKSIHAQTAKAIRQELKTSFPNTKFSVRSESFSMGNAVRIGWTDGVTIEQVKEITEKYEYGHWDGRSDIYELSNHRDDIPQVKWVSWNRKASDQVKDRITDHIRNNYPDCEDFAMDEHSSFFNEWGATIVWRKFYNMDLENNTLDECIEHLTQKSEVL